MAHAIQTNNEGEVPLFFSPAEIIRSPNQGRTTILETMRIRPSILAIAGCLALGPGLHGMATAKPPEDEIAERAERSAERAAKAAERAAEAAERAAERGDKDRGRDRSSDRASHSEAKDTNQRGSEDPSGGASRYSSGEVQLAGLGEGEADSSFAPGETTDDLSGKFEEDSTTSDSNSNDHDIDDGDVFGDPDDKDNSGSAGDDGGPAEAESSGSGSGSDEEDNSGSGSNGGDPDDDDDDDSDEDEDDQDDQPKAYGRLEHDDNGSPFREGELVVMSDDAAILQRAEGLGFTIIDARQLSTIGSIVATLRRPEGVTSAQALELLRAREPASPSGYNYLYRSTAPSRDAPFEEQDHGGLALTLTGTIGVIDGFSGDTIQGWSVERLVRQPARLAHGDIVAEILLEDLADGFGSKPGKLLLMDVMATDGNAGSADVAALVLGLDRMTAAGAKVVNLSLAGPDHAALRRAVAETVRRGVTLVAAVGNAGPAAPPFFPAAYDGVVGVAAVDSGGKPYIYSGRGPHVDVAALGEITPRSRGATQAIGTSYAAPHVTALLAGNGSVGVSVDELLIRHANDAGAPGRDQVFGVGVLSSYSHEYVLAGQPTK